VAEAAQDVREIQNERRPASSTHVPNGHGTDAGQLTPVVDVGFRAALNPPRPGGRPRLPPEFMPRIILGLQRVSGNSAVEEWLETAMPRPAATAPTDNQDQANPAPADSATDDPAETGGSPDSQAMGDDTEPADAANAPEGAAAASPPSETSAAAPKGFAQAAPEGTAPSQSDRPSWRPALPNLGAMVAPAAADAGTLELAGTRPALVAPPAEPTGETGPDTDQAVEGTPSGTTESSSAGDASSEADVPGSSLAPATPASSNGAAAPKSLAKAAPEGSASALPDRAQWKAPLQNLPAGPVPAGAMAGTLELAGARPTFVESAPGPSTGAESDADRPDEGTTPETNNSGGTATEAAGTVIDVPEEEAEKESERPRHRWVGR
jgi:hypothetical protein